MVGPWSGARSVIIPCVVVVPPSPPPRIQTLNMATDPLFLMARYRPGDLGFVPPPTWNQRPSVCRSVRK